MKGAKHETGGKKYTRIPNKTRPHKKTFTHSSRRSLLGRRGCGRTSNYNKKATNQRADGNGTALYQK